MKQSIRFFRRMFTVFFVLYVFHVICCVFIKFRVTLHLLNGARFQERKTTLHEEDDDGHYYEEEVVTATFNFHNICEEVFNTFVSFHLIQVILYLFFLLFPPPPLFVSEILKAIASSICHWW